MKGKQYVWFDGEFVEYEKATVPILTHSLQYGSGVFEGIRSYSSSSGAAVFRLRDHVDRLFRSMKIYGMRTEFSEKDIEKAITGTVKKNGLKDSYIRPIVFYNDQNIGLNVIGKKISIAIAAVEFGNYFQNKNKGVRCHVSTWRRINSAILPPQAKASGNYLNSIIASREAKEMGADEAIMLSLKGCVSEGPGENIFLVESNRLVTPSKESDILIGITRDSVIKLADFMGIGVEEREVSREELYYCDEAFFSGTAAEITPIVEIDSHAVSDGKPGPVARALAEKFSSIVHGNSKEFRDWLTPI